jgi:glycosyltransferase involved in cell wall biosynthesis
MKDFLVILTTTYNEAPLVPWFLRHYEQFADRIIVYDDKSTDGTRELLRAHPKVQLEDWQGDNGIDETQRLEWAYRCISAMKNQCHWLMVVDFDEFIFGPGTTAYTDIRPILAGEARQGVDAIQTSGFNMMYPESKDAGIPDISKHEPTVQLYQLIPNGVRAPVYAKTCIITPEAPVHWNMGRHRLSPECGAKFSEQARLKLLHFRYLSPGYTAQRNARNWDRCCAKTGDKSAAWTCDIRRNSWGQEGTALWTARAQKETFNVIERPVWPN